MGKSKMPGLRKRGRVWHIEKTIPGFGVLRGSTGTEDRELAESILRARVDNILRATELGVRPTRTWREAAGKFLRENSHLSNAKDHEGTIRRLDPYIGKLMLHQVHDGTLERFKQDRLRRDGVKARTVNADLEVVRRITRLSARNWRDETSGHTWLTEAPAISFLPKTDARPPRPMTEKEQMAMLRELPPHLGRMLLFAVNTGCRQEEICGLRWDERSEHDLFVLPPERTKNSKERKIPLNRTALSVVEACKGKHPTYVFTYTDAFSRTERVSKMNNTTWKRARDVIKAPIRVHDLRHTFAMRLREGGAEPWTISSLLGHLPKTITEHYAQPTLSELRTAVALLDAKKNPAEAGLVSVTAQSR